MNDPLNPSGMPPVPPQTIPAIPPSPPVIPPVPPENPYAPPGSTIYSGSEMGLTENDKTMGMVAHLISFAGVILPFPFVNILGPLIVWLTQKDKSSYIDHHGKEALNFQITAAIAGVVGFLSLFLLIGFLILPAVVIYTIVMTIIAGIKAKEGVRYRYPYILRLVK